LLLGLKTARAKDEGHAGKPGRLRTLASPLVAYGGAPPHYRTGAPTAEDYLACWLNDAVYAYRPADEMLGIAALRRRAETLGIPLFAQLAELRGTALSVAVAEVCAASQVETRAAGAGDPPVADAVATNLHALEVLSSWLQQASDGRGLSAAQRSRHQRGLVVQRHQLEAVRSLAATSTFQDAMRGAATGRCRVVGEAAGVGTPDLLPYATAVAQVLGHEDSLQLARNLVAAARRVPLTGARIRRPRWNLDVGIDRVDALLLIFRALSLPRTATLLAAAQGVLGGVVRDAAVLAGLLAGVPTRAGEARRALVVALGLLGVVTDLEVAVPDPTDADDTAAYVLAARLAEPDHRCFADWLLAADRRAEDRAAREVTDLARARLDAGSVLSVID
jgi:hypothetical protein